MTILYGLTAVALGIYAIVLQNRVDELKAENERLMDCIIEIERETGEME
ncbi:hypothetical protein PJK55_14650 [Exiguobacterium sp. MMG028]|nr:hypothetical protein [Exiguobacterium sp. MMG028]MDA5561976.1 hypothetical protein [Exiguobacterium sp. MMG028]